MLTTDIDSALAHFTPFDSGIEIIAAIIGIVVVIFIFKLNRRVGGKLRTALWFFAFAVISNVCGLVWSSLYNDIYVIGHYVVDVGDLFTTFGMIFFSLAAYRFSLLVPHE